MKKLVIFLFVLGFAVTAFAQEVKKELPLKVGVSGIVYGTSYKAIEKDADGSYTAARIRPLFTFTDGNIEAVVKLEMDATFGQKASASGSDDTDALADKSSENVGLGGDKKSVEIANAYVKTKVDAVAGLTLTGGIAGYDFPLVWSDNAPLASANYSNDMVDFGIYYVKPSEGSNNKDKDDSQIYIADAKLKFGESSVRPAFFAFQCKEAAEVGQYKDSTGYIYGLSANIVLGTFGLDISGAYAKGKDKVGDAAATPVKPATKHSGYAFDFAPYIKIETIKITPFFTMVSGDDNTTDGKDTSFINATIDGGSVAGAGINNFRLYIIEDGGSFTSNNDVATSDNNSTGKYDNTNGYLAYGLSVGGEFGAITVKLQGAYVQAPKVASGADKDMGIEFDANVGYALTKTSTLYVEGAILKTGKYYENAGGDTQTAQYINVGMTYSI